MSVNVEVSSKSNESNSSLLRRFSRRVKGSGILGRARGLRFNSRNHSSNIKRQQKIKHLKRLDSIAEQIKLGKAPDRRRKYEYVTDKEE